MARTTTLEIDSPRATGRFSLCECACECVSRLQSHSKKKDNSFSIFELKHWNNGLIGVDVCVCVCALMGYLMIFRLEQFCLQPYEDTERAAQAARNLTVPCRLPGLSSTLHIECTTQANQLYGGSLALCCLAHLTCFTF